MTSESTPASSRVLPNQCRSACGFPGTPARQMVLEMLSLTELPSTAHRRGSAGCRPRRGTTRIGRHVRGQLLQDRVQCDVTGLVALAGDRDGVGDQIDVLRGMQDANGSALVIGNNKYRERRAFRKSAGPQIALSQTVTSLIVCIAANPL